MNKLSRQKRYLYIIPVLLLITIVILGLISKSSDTLNIINLFILSMSVLVAIIYVVVEKMKMQKRKNFK